MSPAFHRLSEKSEFYLLRHGESEGNRSGRVQGRADYRLSETGREHAQAAAEWLRDCGITRCITSPLLRSSETAELVSAGLRLPPPEPLEYLTEIDTGLFTDSTLDECAERFPEAYRRFLVESWDAVPDAESSSMLYKRAVQAWDHMIDLSERGEQKLLCVTHSGILQWLIKATVGVEGQRWMPIFRIANCAVSLFAAEPAGAPGEGYFGQWTLLGHVPYEL